MEKLQPLIKHRFWILSGLVVVLSLLGWYLGSNNLAASTKKRTEKINSTEANLPKKGETHPNKDWIFGLQERNDYRADQSNKKATDLHAQQLISMDWPASIAANFNGVPYRQPAISTSSQKKNDIPQFYRTFYKEDVINTLPQIVKPYNKDTGEGIVEFRVDQMGYFPNWVTYTPTWDEMWDVQEDFWLTRSLLTAISKVNSQGKATNHDDAVIQAIKKIELHAGSTPQPHDYSGSKPKGMKGGQSAAGPQQRGPSAASAGGGGGTSRSKRGATQTADQKNAEIVPITPDIKIDPVDVFGVPTVEGDSASSAGEMSLGAPPGEEDEGDLNASATNSKPRYVEKSPEFPFKTRGFILVLRMKSESLPLLLKELNQLEWPVEIRRVNWKLEDPDVQGENRVHVQFSSSTQESKNVTRNTRGKGNSEAKGLTQSVGDGNSRGNTRRRQSKTNDKTDSKKIGTLDLIPDRRSDIEVQIAGVLTIYRPPAKGSKIEIPTLKTAGKSTKKAPVKSSPKTKKKAPPKLNKFDHK